MDELRYYKWSCDVCRSCQCELFSTEEQAITFGITKPEKCPWEIQSPNWKVKQIKQSEDL